MPDGRSEISACAMVRSEFGLSVLEAVAIGGDGGSLAARCGGKCSLAIGYTPTATSSGGSLE
jgi:hypothetical protein